MPKEVFKSVNEKSQDPNLTSHRLPELSVGWGNHGAVQFGVTLAPEEVRSSLRARMPDITEELCEEVLEALTGPESGALGWFTHLDRSDCNRLIKAVRRARDHEFGADA